MGKLKMSQYVFLLLNKIKLLEELGYAACTYRYRYISSSRSIVMFTIKNNKKLKK